MVLNRTVVRFGLFLRKNATYKHNSGEEKMSRHPSLKGTGTIRKKRNVLKRFERINLLTADGRWKPGQKVLNGLPKTKPID